MCRKTRIEYRIDYEVDRSNRYGNGRSLGFDSGRKSYDDYPFFDYDQDGDAIVLI